MNLFLSFLIFISSQSVFATITSEANVQVPYSPTQSTTSYEQIASHWGQGERPNMFCMADRMFIDHHSSSNIVVFKMMVEPFWIRSIQDGFPDEQVNAIYDGKIKVSTDWEAFEKYTQLKEGDLIQGLVAEPHFVVDVSAYNKKTKAGRLEALVKAKLAIATIHYNLAYWGRYFRASIQVKGLPENQLEFVGANWTPVKKLYKESYNSRGQQTGWPLSGPSPVAQSFYSELFSQEFCRDDVERAQSFAQ